MDAVHVKIAPATLAIFVDGGIRRQTKRERERDRQTDRQTDRHPAGSEAGRWQTHH